MENEQSNVEVENGKKEIETFKRKVIIVASIIIGLIIIILIAVLFINKKEDLTVTKFNTSESNNTKVSKIIEQENQSIKKFSDYNELRDFLENNSSQTVNEYYADDDDEGFMLPETNSVMVSEKATYNDSVETTSVVSSRADNKLEYSETNIQVEGVDEADIIKTDGNYIYAVSNKNLFIVDSKDPKNLNILSKIEFENQPQNIYLNKDRLIVFGNDDEIYQEEFYANFKRNSQYTFFKIFDISDRQNPKQLKDYDFEGYYSNSRMIGDYVYFLTNSSNIAYTDVFPVPRVLEDEKEIYDYSDERNCLGNCPDVYYIDDISNNYTMVNIMTINVQDVNIENNNSLSHRVYLMPYNQNLYVSQDNLYLTYTKQLNQQEFLTNLKLEIVWNKLSISEQNKINEIKNAKYFILSRSEKIRKIENIINRSTVTENAEKVLDENLKNKVQEMYPQIVDKLEETVVHKIAIDGGNLEYKGFGAVPGTVLNQFSMDENGDNFRIATTRNRDWSYWLKQFGVEGERESYNNLYVLDKSLKVMGSVERLAEGERIYSTRFMGDRAYIVTFRQTDPLFVIDLKNPKDPKVLGQLKIPGFSNYLHPYDENHLIGIGKDTDVNVFGGVTTEGLKVALFDVSDVTNPKEKAKYILGGKGSDSLALRDHKAVLFDKEKNLLVIPVTLRAYENEAVSIPVMDSDMVSERYMPVEKYFVGAAVLNIDDSNIGLRGLISHSKNSSDNWCMGNCYNNVILRSLWIDDVLYTFSNGFLQANDISSLDLIKKLELKFIGSDYRVVN